MAKSDYYEDFMLPHGGSRTAGHYGPVDERGNPVRRTKQTHPYSYDGFVLWKSRDYKPTLPAGTIYSDRLYEWDYEKAMRLGEKHQIRRWDNTPTKQIEAFLRDWNDDPKLHLVLVMEYCNQASGYPVWRFDYLSSGSNSDD